MSVEKKICFLSFELISDSCNKQQVSWFYFWGGHQQFQQHTPVLLESVFQRWLTYHARPEKGQHEAGENSDLQKYNRQWVFPISCCLYDKNGGTRKYKPEAPIRTVANKTERKNESTLNNWLYRFRGLKGGL